MSYKVDKAVPIPGPRKASARFPVASLEIGDSFEVPPSERGGAYLACRKRKKMGALIHDDGWDYAVRILPSKNLRFWRTA